ncbi:hypothetical protein C3V38_07870 [Dietzia sp. oral taxon 368]|uniref:helix-turn-helix transcriptional regulator n=1 Tax=Dietzia sp. oral taxon 368 TaxID=712270 RepID=UPI000D0928C1|nr:helix-turn-helix domain-containing protein [Dietzia sp. oral taxon 368]AVM64320.1 hypothetical protein C3V38_07870 [Dietzia sp. oral taxon 368]
MTTELIGASEAARILGVARQTVARQANDGLLPTLGRIGPREAFVFQRSSIEALAAERAGVKR